MFLIAFVFYLIIGLYRYTSDITPWNYSYKPCKVTFSAIKAKELNRLLEQTPDINALDSHLAPNMKGCWSSFASFTSFNDLQNRISDDFLVLSNYSVFSLVGA